MSLAAGISTFSSCNKAGSIPHFTAHLQRYPNNYTALNWRGRAYSIIGDIENAIKDFEKAARVSNGARVYINKAHIERLKGNAEQTKILLTQATTKYPSCAEAWADRGTDEHGRNDNILAAQSLQKAIDLGKSQYQMSETWYPWANKTMGDIHLSRA